MELVSGLIIGVVFLVLGFLLGAAGTHLQFRNMYIRRLARVAELTEKMEQRNAAEIRSSGRIDLH